MDKLPKNALTLWTINDEGVLTKIRRKDQALTLEHAFPQIERANFFWKETEALWCLVRKTHWQTWMEKIVNAPVILLHAFMGSELLATLNQTWNETISTNRYSYQFTAGQLEALTPMKEPSNQEITIAGNQLPANSLLGFAAVLHYYKHYPIGRSKSLLYLLTRTFRALPQLDNPFEQLQTTVIFEGLNRRFRQFFIQVNIVLLSGLVGGSLLLQLWENKQATAQLIVETEHRKLTQQLSVLDSLWVSKDQKWKQLEHKAAIQIVPFIDGVLQTLPVHVTLEELQWEEQAPHLFLKGRLQQKTVLTSWVEELQQLTVVENVQVAQLVGLNASDFQFELQITFYAPEN